MQIEQDARLILETLAEWSVSENDSNTGHHTVSIEELQEQLEIPSERCSEAITYLLHLGYISLSGYPADSGTNNKDVELEPAGREAHLNSRLRPAEKPRPQATGYDVFLSHSNLDYKLASDIKKLLEANRIRVFVAPPNIPLGKWNARIEEALQNSASIWVLLTPNAIQEGIYIHHQLGYFYGYIHGRGHDEARHNCKYLYMKGTDRPGLYGRVQGIRVDSFEDPVLVAEIIAKEMSREFILQTGWITEVGTHKPAGIAGHPDVNQPVISVTKRAYGPGTTEVVIFFQNISETMHHVSILTAHPDVKIIAIGGSAVIMPSYPYPIIFRLRNREQPLHNIPEELEDDFGRRFNVKPGPDASEGKVPLLITYDGKGGRGFAAVFYYTINQNSEGYPDIDIDPPVPLEWRQEVISSQKPVGGVRG